MSPKTDNQDPSVGPDVTVEIPHGQTPASPVPVAAPPLPEIEPLPVRPINITDNTPTPPPAVPPMPPVMPDEFHVHENRRWPVLLVYTILALLVAVMVVFAGRWIYRKTTNHTAKTTTTNQGNVPAAPPTNTESNNPTNSNSTGAEGKPITTNGQLPNNGPGDVVAIFVGATLVVGGLHYLYGLRRQK